MNKWRVARHPDRGASMTPERVAEIAAKIIDDCGGINQPEIATLVERAIRAAVNEFAEEAAKIVYELDGSIFHAAAIRALKLPEE